MGTTTEPIQITLSDNQKERLNCVLNETNQSQDLVIHQAIDQYIELYEWQKERIQQRLEKANSTDAVFHSSKEIDGFIERMTS